MLKDARRSQNRVNRPRRRFKSQEPQRLTTAVIVLCSALFSMLDSDVVECRQVALELLTAANEAFAFGLAERTLQVDGEFDGGD